MNKIILLTFFIISISGINAFQLQGNDLVPKSINEKNEKLRYEINVSYHELSGYKDKSAQDAFNKCVNDLIKSAVDTFKHDMQDWEVPKDLSFSSDYEIADTILYSSNDLISIKFDGYSYYAGAAHPITFFFSICYDLKNNKVINLSDMFTGNYLKTISNLCITDLTRQKDAYTDNPDVSWITEGAGPKAENYKVFNFTNSTLLITFPVYQVASYAEGPKEVEIPYSKLRDIINPEGPLGFIVK